MADGSAPITAVAAAVWRPHRRFAAPVLSTAFVLAAAMAYLGAQSLAPIAAMAGFLLLPGLRWRAWRWALAALLAWALISMAWTIQPVAFGAAYASIERLTFVKLAGMAVLLPSLAAGASRLSPAEARRVSGLGAWALMGLSAVIIADSLTGARLYQAIAGLAGIHTRIDIAAVKVSQASAAVVLLMWPAHVRLSRAGFELGAPVFVMAAGCAALLLGYDVALLAVLTGAAAFVSVKRFGAAAVRVWAGLAAAYWLFAPLVVAACDRFGLIAFAAGKLPPSWDARLNIWTFTAQRIGEHPLRGWGLDASRAFGLRIPLHPHNGALQVWLELGLPGALLAALLTGLLAHAIARRCQNRDAAAAATAAATAFLTVGALSYGAWQEWWLGLGAVTAAACALLFLWQRQPMSPMTVMAKVRRHLQAFRNRCGYAFDRMFKTGRRRHEFEHKYARDGDTFHYRTDPYEHAKYARTLERLLRWNGGRGALLEIGCSVGVFTAMAAQHYGEVTATDIAQQALNLARREVAGAGDVSYVRSDVEGLDLGRRFDVVLCAEVLMYVREANAAQVCEVLDRHLAPGGIIVEVSQRDRAAGRPKFFHGWDDVLGRHFQIIHRDGFDDPVRPYEIVAYARRQFTGAAS